jgi:hypothetical protein
MIAVLAAMLFIGIVTASMVKNTKSQSTASIGYGTMQIMSSTVRSGMIATETYFAKNNASSAVNVLKNVVTNGDSIVFGKNRNKEKIAEGQFFSSRVAKYHYTFNSEDDQYVEFDVRSGRGKVGKDLKKARVFYRVGNAIVKSDGSFGNNAFFTGKGTVVKGNAGTEIIGHATFENGLLTQNEAPVKFSKDDKGQGSVYVKGKLDILNNYPVNFDVPVFVDGITEIQNLPDANGSVFRENVGFNGNIIVPANKSIAFDRNVWFNGSSITQGPSATQPTLTANGVNQKFYYSSNIPMETKAMDNGRCKTCGTGSKGCIPNTTNCCVHSCNHPDTASRMIQDAKRNGFVNLHEDSTSGYLESNIPTATMLGELDMLGSRAEPDLDLSRIPESTTPLSVAATTKVGYDNVYDILNQNGSLKSGEDLTAFIKAARNDDTYKNNFYNDHLLVKIPASGAGSTVDFSGGTFNEKIIFIVEGSMGGSAASFYNSAPNASTLIYVEKGEKDAGGNIIKKGGTLNQFGTVNNGTFRGLIYVAPENYADHTFSWGKDTNVEGAVILKGGNLNWNNNVKGGITKIRHDPTVLKNYGPLISDGGELDVTIIDDSKGVILKPLGYYFF